MLPYKASVVDLLNKDLNKRITTFINETVQKSDKETLFGRQKRLRDLTGDEIYRSPLVVASMCLNKNYKEKFISIKSAKYLCMTVKSESIF